jgi:hypothetical protein
MTECRVIASPLMGVAFATDTAAMAVSFRSKQVRRLEGVNGIHLE